MVELHTQFEDTFAYCNFDVDFKNKKINIDYPEEPDKLNDTLNRIFLSLLPALCFLFIMIFIEIFLDIFFGLWIYVPWYLVASLFLTSPAILVWDYYTRIPTKFFIKHIGTPMFGGKKRRIVIMGKQTRKTFKIIHCGNTITEYKARKDYAKYIKNIKMNLVDYDYGSEYDDENKMWQLSIEFTKVPKRGYIIIMNRSFRQLKLT